MKKQNFTAAQVAVPEMLYTRFREPVNVFASKTGEVLCRDDLSREVSPATVARAVSMLPAPFDIHAGTKNHPIEAIRDGVVQPPLLMLDSEAIFTRITSVETLPIRTRGEEPTETSHSQLGCYIPPWLMLEKFGITVGACGITGQLLPDSKAVEGSMFDECADSQIGPDAIRDHGEALSLLPHILEIEEMLNNPTMLDRPLEAVRLDSPEGYDTDAPVSEGQKEKGIRAWRRLENPANADQSIMLPIYDTDLIPYDLESTRAAEAAKVPRAGDDGSPENFIDYDGILYPLAVSMVALRDSPALWGGAGLGKGSPLDEPVLTPKGWRAIGDLEVDDFVIGSSGERTRVTGVFDRGVLPTYRVSMTDGSSVRVDGDHLWSVITLKGVSKVISTSDLLTSELQVSDGTRKYGIPLVGEVEFDRPVQLSIHPYVMGALLANGYSPTGRGQVYFSSNSDSIRDAVSSFEAGWSDASPMRGTRRLAQVSSRGDFINRWAQLGLHGVKSREKFVPDEYLYASIENRRLLLAGLMDCDGRTSSNGSRASYSTTSENLRDAVIHLVRSLGGEARWSVTDVKRKPYFTVSIHMSDTPFMFGDRGSRWSKNTGRLAPARKIKSIERIEDHEIRCIAVKASDHLYVTKDFIVTHNTAAYKHLSYLMGLPFERISITMSTEVDELAGKMEYHPDEGTVFRYGRLANAWTKPSVICLDEPNSARPDVWFMLRPLLDSEKQLAIDASHGEILPRHESSYLGLAMNPSWDYRNSGTNPLADADVSRLTHVQVGLPPENVEADIVRMHSQTLGFNISDSQLRQMRKIANDLRDTAAAGSLMFSWGTRSQLKVAKLLPYMTMEQAYQAALGASLEPEQEDLFLSTVRGHL